VLLDSDCIQVDGLQVAGIPVGSPEFIPNYVRSKAMDIVKDIAKLDRTMGIAPPAMAPYADQICPCLRQRLDTDHLHTCSKHSGNWYGAHELVLSAVADIAHAAGFRTNRCSRVPTSRGQQRGDLEIKGLNVAGTTDPIVDVALVHDFHGNVVDHARHGQPRNPNPDKVLIDTAVAKAHGTAYRPDYLRNHNKAFLPLVMSTSGRLHSEFARLLYILAHQRAVRFFATLHYEPFDEELCQRRGAFFPRPPVGARRPPSTRRPGSGSLALSSHAAFEDSYDPDV
jgi:hypothetical protein